MLAASLLSLFVVPFLMGSLFWVPILLGVVGSLGAFSYLASLERGPGERRFTPGHYRLTDDGFWAWQDGSVERVVTPETVAAGWCEAGEAGPALVLRLHDGSLVAVEPEDRQSLEVLMDRAGLPPSARAERMRLGRDDPGGRMVATLLLGPVLLFGLPLLLSTLGSIVMFFVAPAPYFAFSIPVSLVMSSLVLLLGSWLGAKLVPTWLRIGSDGVLVRRLVRAFVPYGELRGARIEGGPSYFKVVLERTKGRPIQIPASSQEQARAVVDQIDNALDRYESRHRAALADALECGERDASTWRKDLGCLLQEGGYRSQALDREHLVRVAEDPGQPERVRVAAAVALQPTAAAEERKRVRVAAQASASPRVRVALEQAIEGELEDEALAALR